MERYGYKGRKGSVAGIAELRTPVRPAEHLTVEEVASRRTADRKANPHLYRPETPEGRAAWLAEMNAQQEARMAAASIGLRRTHTPIDPLSSIRPEWPYLTGNIFTKGYDY